MQLFDRDRLAILILAGSCWLPTASAEKPAEGAGKGDSKNAPARLETFTAEQKAHWAYQPLKRPELPDVPQAELGSQPDRPLHPRRAGKCRATSRAGGAPNRPDPAPDIRPDRFASSPRRGCRFPDRPEARCVRAAAGESPLRRALGPALAGPGPLCRLERLRARRRAARCLALSRLGGPRLNADLPYDRFVVLQIAGDEVKPGDHEALIATGFGRCGPRELARSSSERP